MDFFNKVKAVRLKSHLDKYLVADDDEENIRQSRNGSSRKARWLVELVVDDATGNSHFIRLKSGSGKYLMASDEPFLLGMTGRKILHTLPEKIKDERIEWEPIRDGFQVKLRGFGGKYLRANGGTPPWRNKVTHDNPYSGSTQNWILWNVEPIDVPENESLTDYLTMVSSFSSVSDELSSLDLGSPVSVHSSFSFSSPRMAKSSLTKTPAMELFHKAKAVRLQSHHDKYLTAEEDEESVTQDRSGASKNAKWTLEFVPKTENVIRLKSCYGKYLTASNQPFLLGMTGRKVLQSLPARLDSSVEWEPIREGQQVKLRTRYGQFLRGNGGLPPWRNSVTHDIPQRTKTQDWVLWDVHVVEILPHSSAVPAPVVAPELQTNSDSFASESGSPTTTGSSKSQSFSRQESSDSLVNSPPKLGDGRLIYYHITDEFGEVEEGTEGLYIAFKGNSVEDLKKRLEEETGLEDITVCTRSPLNGKQLYPLRLQLPPNNANMNVIILPSSSKEPL